MSISVLVGSTQKPIPHPIILMQGVALANLVMLAIIVPSMSSTFATLALGWLFLACGIIDLPTTFWAHYAPVFWWSHVSALLATLAGRSIPYCDGVT